MIIESLLPLGKLDPGLREPDTPLDIRRFGELAQTAEQVGLGEAGVPRRNLFHLSPRHGAGGARCGGRFNHENRRI